MKTSVRLSILYAIANTNVNFETLCENYFVFLARSRPKASYVISVSE